MEKSTLKHHAIEAYIYYVPPYTTDRRINALLENKQHINKKAHMSIYFTLLNR